MRFYLRNDLIAKTGMILCHNKVKTFKKYLLPLFCFVSFEGGFCIEFCQTAETGKVPANWTLGFLLFLKSLLQIKFLASCLDLEHYQPHFFTRTCHAADTLSFHTVQTVCTGSVILKLQQRFAYVTVTWSISLRFKCIFSTYAHETQGWCPMERHIYLSVYSVCSLSVGPCWFLLSFPSSVIIWLWHENGVYSLWSPSSGHY